MSDVIQGFPQGNFDEKEDMQKGRWAENENLKTWQTDQQEKDIGIAKSMQKHMGGTKNQDTTTSQGFSQGILDEDIDAPKQPWKGEMVNPEAGILGQKEEVMRKRHEDQIHKGEPGVSKNFGEKKFQNEKPEMQGERSTEKMKKEGDLAENMEFIQKGDTETKPHLDLRGSQKTFPAQELVYHSEKEKDKDIDKDTHHGKKTNLTEHQNEWVDQLNESGGDYKKEQTLHKGEHPKEVGAGRSVAARQKQQHPFPQQESRLKALAQDYERQKVAVEEQLHRNKQQQNLEKMTLKQQMKPTQHFREGKRDQHDIDRQHQKNQNQMSEKRKAHQEIQTSVKAVK